MTTTKKWKSNLNVTAVQFDGRNEDACRKVAGDGEIFKMWISPQAKEDDAVDAFVFSFPSLDPEYNHAADVGDWIVSINGATVTMTDADFTAFCGGDSHKKVAGATA